MFFWQLSVSKLMGWCHLLDLTKLEKDKNPWLLWFLLSPGHKFWGVGSLLSWQVLPMHQLLYDKCIWGSIWTCMQVIEGSETWLTYCYQVRPMMKVTSNHSTILRFTEQQYYIYIYIYIYNGFKSPKKPQFNIYPSLL